MIPPEPARYTDGMPVVGGPFGGDDVTPGEAACLARLRERDDKPRPRRRGWRRMIPRGRR